MTSYCPGFLSEGTFQTTEQEGESQAEHRSVAEMIDRD